MKLRVLAASVAALLLSAGVPQRNLADLRNCYALALLPDTATP